MTEPTKRFLSLGAGVQSSTCLLLAAQGRIPAFDAAIFSDTGWEPAAVYEHLHRLESLARSAGIPLVRVSAGHIRADALDPDHRFASMPLFTLGPDAERGMARRQCSVICTYLASLVMTLSIMTNEEFRVNLRVQLMEGHASVPSVGEVVPSGRLVPPLVVLDGLGQDVQPVTAYLRDLTVSDCSGQTVRSYAYGLLRWFRLLWLLEVGWERATEAEVVVLVGWLRSAVNPQRRRSTPQSAPAGSVNVRTGRPMLATGYAPSTINHALSVVSGFYRFHAHFGQGPVANPVPVAPQRRRALSHRSPLEAQARHGRARLRQKSTTLLPRAIPDRQWDELFEAVGCDRDRALLEFFVSSGARAAELLGVGIDDIDWAQQRIWVISKGTRARQMIPASPKAFVFLARYLDEAGIPPPGSPLWRTRRGETKPLAYWALRRIMQRVNARLGTNWTLHDLRHTAATRMANGGKLTLAEVQAILRHADIRTTGRYLVARVEDLVDKLTEHYARPRPEITYTAGYDPADITAVFGG